MEQLLAELADEFGDGRIFRPYRDVRLSADKTPYKTSCAATVGDGYLALSADGLTVASGIYMRESAELQRFRAAIDAEVSGAELVEIVAALHAADYQITAHNVLKGAPREYSREQPRIELLRHKGIAITKTWPVGAQWLDRHVR